jgi:hypothetical protein
MINKLFVQAGTYPTASLIQHLEGLLTRGVMLDALVFDTCVDPSGMLWPNLTTVQPYLPGGNRAVSRNVFVGGMYPPYDPVVDGTGVSSPDWARDSRYAGGITVPAWRWSLIERSLTGMASYLASFGDYGVHWYIPEECNLGIWGGFDFSAGVRASYEAYLIELCRQLHQLLPGRSILWSPFVWERWRNVSSARAAAVADAVATTVGNVRDWLRIYDHIDAGVDRLDLQDGLGAGAVRAVTITDALGWLGAFTARGLRPRVNVELFTTGFIPISTAAANTRVARYHSAGYLVGACWELRYYAALEGL